MYTLFISLIDSPQRRVYLQPNFVEAAKVINNPSGDPIIALLIEDVNMHGRAVEALDEQLSEITAGKPETIELNYFMSRLRDKLESAYPEICVETSSLIRAGVIHVLSAAPVTRETVLVKKKEGDEEGLTVEDLLQLGLFTLQQFDAQCLLLCPYILLWIFAKHANIAALKEMDFDVYEEHVSKLGRNTWQHYEKFLANYRAVRSHVFNGQLVPVSTIHRGATLGAACSSLKVCSKALCVVLASEQYASRSGNLPFYRMQLILCRGQD